MRLSFNVLIMKGLLFIVFLYFGMSVYSQQELSWKLFLPGKKVWIEVGTHGSVQEYLINQKILPDPFYGKNELLFNWIENHQWVYKSEFTISDSQLGQSSIRWCAPSIDTYANVYINNQLVLKASNAFLPYQVEIKKYLILGINSIRVVFTPPVMYHDKIEPKQFLYPAPNDNGRKMVAPLTRKPQYQFGWDWALRMNTLGFLKPVTIEFGADKQLKIAKIETVSLDDTSAIIELSGKFPNSIKDSSIFALHSNIFGMRQVMVLNGWFKLKVSISNPKLWWPKGFGAPYLYEDEWVIKDNSINLYPPEKVVFGIRKVELIQEKDAVGTSFYFKINGKKVFCKGANYIPEDVFPGKIKKENTLALLDAMDSSNFNCVRVWGGGDYPTSFFYEECDRRGIMVWQDLMFACAMYPANKDFLDLVGKEMDEHLPRISSHPSVILINGNNEVDVAWKYWGFQKKYAISNQRQKEIEKAYDLLFKNFIAKKVEDYCWLPYTPTSPLGHWINKEDFPHGTQHYWGVWHGSDPIEDFSRKFGRFNAEYGFQSFPERKTLLTFSDSTQWNLSNPIMQHHQKSYVGNGMIKKHSDRLFGVASNFEEFVYFSQLTQAKGVGMAISSHRLNAPICMGTIYWQLNDCWPGPTWSSIDFFGNWKALHYKLKHLYKSVTVLEYIEELNREKYVLTSDLPLEINVNYKVRVISEEGTELLLKSDSVKLNQFDKIELLNDSELLKIQSTNVIVECEWTDEHQKWAKQRFYHQGKISNKTNVDVNQVKWEIVALDSIRQTGVIEISTVYLLKDCWLTSDIQGVHFDTNFENILPGVNRINFVFHDKVPTKKSIKLIWR